MVIIMFIKIAGFVIEIKNKRPFTHNFCQDYITDCRNADFSVEASGEAMRKAIAEYPEFPDGYLECLEIYREICRKILDYNAMLMHCAAIAVDGQAYLFTAVSGTGKTTHISLWLKKFGSRAVVVNGDKPILRLIDDKFYVCGTPWCGKEGLGENITAPVKAICILERDSFNHIEKIEPADAISTVITQTLRTNSLEEMDKMLSLADKLLTRVPFYRLGCNMESEAADVSYNAMSKA